MVRHGEVFLFKKHANFMKYLTVVNKRYKRGHLKPVLDPHEVGTIPEYPPVMPILPIKEKLRLKWRDNILAQETPSDFLYHIWKVNGWNLDLRPVNYHSGCLPFFKHATKTFVVDGLPEEIMSRTEDASTKQKIEKLREDVKAIVLQQHFHYTHKNNKPNEWLYTGRRMTRNLANLLLNSQKINTPHLQDSDLNYDVDVKSHWIRGSKKFMYDIPINAHITNKLPLKQFTPLDSELSIGDVPSWDYDPINISVFEKHLNPIFFPGFKIGNPFKYSHTQFFACTLDRKRCMKKKSSVRQVFIGQGIASSFGMLSALAAYNMNYWDRDLQTPLTNQTIVFDGQRLSFFCYQLNTLAIDEHNNPNNSRRNVCWHLQDVLLYSDIKDGVVRDLNGDALKLLVAFMQSPTEVATSTSIEYIDTQKAVSV
ncbi:large ribosomal subunit protein mL65-like [Antedon mediterranea]|uniref:large ribosomal subunit protein mL65-like n=1 Tax=Antedon mediterranea TaxID=105859 RepID=UPI003AF81BA6